MNDNHKGSIVNLTLKQNSQPITLHEIEEEMKKRLSIINQEFLQGFEFIKNQPKSVTLFGSSRMKSDSKYYRQASNLGYKLAKLGYTVFTGGGPGLMEGANRGAFDAGGQSVGINIQLPHEQTRNPYLTDTLEFYYFFTRKVIMSFSAEAYIFFPGGFGTLDELFEILTLLQTKKIEKVPVILIGSDFWNNLQEFIATYLLNAGLIDKQDLDLYMITDDEDEIVEIVKKVPIRNGVRLTHAAAEAPTIVAQ